MALTVAERDALLAYQRAQKNLLDIDKALDLAEVERQEVAERIAELMRDRVDALEAAEKAVEALRQAIKRAP